MGAHPALPLRSVQANPEHIRHRAVDHRLDLFVLFRRQGTKRRRIRSRTTIPESTGRISPRSVLLLRARRHKMAAALLSGVFAEKQSLLMLAEPAEPGVPPKASSALLTP
jgi:hypothetical protein